MTITAQNIAELINGELEGDASRIIKNIAKIEEAQPCELTFLSNEKYLHFIHSTGSDVIIINRNFINDSILEIKNKTFIIVEDAHVSFVKLLQIYNEMIGAKAKRGIHPTAIIETKHPIPDSVYIGPYTWIQEEVIIGAHSQISGQCTIESNCIIGENAQIKAGVRILYNTVIGRNVVIHPNTVIGSDGFGFQPNAEGIYSKVPQIGSVLIHDNVEIGANCTIDRATMGKTIIHSGVKIDNLVQIAHNVTIGQNTVIAAQTGISGSTKIGKNCIIGGQVGIVGHIQIADKTLINAQSGVSKSVKEPGKKLTGSPAFDYNSALKSQVLFKRLPEIEASIHQLKLTIDSNFNTNKTER